MSDSNQPSETAGSEPQHPASLAGGTIETALNQNRQRAMSSESAVRLCDQLLRELGSLRMKWGQPIFEVPSEDPVLQLCIATQNKEDIPDELLAKAEHHLEHRPRDYRLVLGELIPEDVRARVRARLAQTAYLENRNPTAAKDWGVFWNTMQEGSRKGLHGPTTGLPKLDSMLRRPSRSRPLSVAIRETARRLSPCPWCWPRSTLTRTARRWCTAWTCPRRGSTRGCSAASPESTTARCGTPKESPEAERQITQADQHLRRDILPRLRVIERDFSCEEVWQDDNTQTLAQKRPHLPRRPD